MSAINYSKWDTLELSDDDDFECHPNVDKKSMVRWKQAQVHKARRERDDQRALLSLEAETTERFIVWLPTQTLPTVSADLVMFLAKLGPQVELLFTDPMKALSASRVSAWPRNWDPPVWGTVLQNHQPWHEQIANILHGISALLVRDRDTNVLEYVNDELKKSLQRYRERLPIIYAQIALLDTEINAKITTESLRTGFDKTTVAKRAAVAADGADSSEKNTVVETIHEPSQSFDIYPELQAEIYAELNASDEHLIAAHPKLLQFSYMSELADVARIMKANPEINTELCEETLLIRALAREICGATSDARKCVLTSLALKYSRSLGQDGHGADVFFGRMQSGASSAYKLFYGDIQKTYEHIQSRGKVLRGERVASHNKELRQEAIRAENVQKFYNICLQPDGTIKLPLTETASEAEKTRAAWFEGLPGYYQEGLLLEDVEKINKFLSSLSVEDSEREARLATEAGFIQFEEAGDEETEEVESAI